MSEILLNPMLNDRPILKRVLLHALFWTAWMSRTFYDIVSLYSWQGAFVFSFSYILAQMPFVYLHLYVLVPKLLNRKKYLLYIPCTIALLFIYSYLSYFILSHIPHTWLPAGLELYVSRINPNYDILEGFFAFIITYSLKYTWMTLSTQNKVLALQKENLQLELKALKAQVNPHFLFNTLNNIYALSLQKSEQTPGMLLKLSSMMRYLLYECNVPQVALQKEIQFINNYIELEKIRHSKNVQINFSLSGNAANSEIAPLLLIPFVENSFKHGVNARIGKGWVDIHLSTLDDKISLSVVNSMAENHVNGSAQKGIGLENVKKRLELLYPGKHTLAIEPGNEKYSVNLAINLNGVS
jgi:two-component system LytT family sensor kinase